MSSVSRHLKRQHAQRPARPVPWRALGIAAGVLLFLLVVLAFVPLVQAVIGG